MKQDSALVYCRVSSGAQEQDGTSLDTQEQRCRAYAAEHGLEVTAVYRETYTGAELGRPKLDALRARVRAGGIAAVIVYALDRLSRGQGFAPVLMDEFMRRGCVLLFVTDPPEDTDEGKLFITITEYVAVKERRKIAERTARGRKAKAEAGLLCGGSFALFGYQKDPEARQRVVYEPEAAVVRDIFTSAADGDSLHAIARRLNARGVPTRVAGKKPFKYRDGNRQRSQPSGKWDHKAVASILRNPSYKGEMPAYLGVAMPAGTRPALVSPELWAQAQRTFAKAAAIAAADRTKNEARPHLLRGMVFCGTCGHRLHINPVENRFYYRCGSRQMSCGPCGARAVPEAKLDEWVWDLAETALSVPEAIVAEIRDRWAEGPDRRDAEDLEAAKVALADLDREEAQLIKLYARLGEGGPSLDAVERELLNLREKREVWQETAERARARLAQDERELAGLDNLASYIEGVEAEIAGYGFEGRRRACEKLGVVVTADDEDWRCEFNIPGLGEHGNVICARGQARRPIHAAVLGKRAREWGPPWGVAGSSSVQRTFPTRSNLCYIYATGRTGIRPGRLSSAGS
jgi:site-specific DNA recombinase